jgi:opacity protein-like surface antigen
MTDNYYNMILKYQPTMKHSLGLAVAGATLILAVDGQAQDASRFYLDAKAGVALAQDTSVQASPFGNSGSIHFDTGFRADLGLGYNLCDCFAVELEPGVVWNSIHQIASNRLSEFNSSADLYQIPIMVNGIYKFPLHGNFKPYVGVGAGAVAGLFDGSNIPFTSSSYRDVDFTFAYQATVGFKYSVCQHAELGLAYEFLGTTDHEWSDQGVTFKSDGTMTHAILATLTWKF